MRVDILVGVSTDSLGIDKGLIGLLDPMESPLAPSCRLGFAGFCPLTPREIRGVAGSARALIC